MLLKTCVKPTVSNPGTDRSVTAREIEIPSCQPELSSRIVIWSRPYSPLQRVVDTAVKRKKRRRGIQHRRPIRVALHRIACPHSLRPRIHMHTQVSSQHMH